MTELQRSIMQMWVNQDAQNAWNSIQQTADALEDGDNLLLSIIYTQTRLMQKAMKTIYQPEAAIIVPSQDLSALLAMSEIGIVEAIAQKHGITKQEVVK